MKQEIDTAREAVLTKLSKQELLVFKRIARGESPILSAAQMGLAVKTVATYRARIMEKLDLRSNAEIAVLAFELGMVPSVAQRFQEEKQNEDT